MPTDTPLTLDSPIMQLQALHQSMVETAACPRAYVEMYIKGNRQPESIPSERGTEIHHVMSQYIDHCTRYKLAADWNHFNKLTVAAGPQAGPILDGIRDCYVVDWNRVYSTELTLALDENFEPTYAQQFRGQRLLSLPGIEFTEEPSAHEGTLDVLLINETGDHAKIEDFKSHPAVFDADTFQGTLYPFMVFKHLPQVQIVTFELNFVRYTNCRRTVQWRRSDMPEMQAIISRARERQRLTHQNPDDAKALPCTVCAYCPLAKNLTCPIAEWNEYTQLSLVDRVMWAVWLSKMAKANTAILRAHSEVHGAYRYTDGNGKVYEYGEQEVPSTRIPLDQTTINVLTEYHQATGENLLDGRLNVSSTKLKQLLNTKKRASLRERFEESIYETSTKPKYEVRTPEGLLDNGYNSED